MLDLILLFLLILSHSHNIDSLNEEGTALLSFKQSVKDPQGSLKNWNFSDETPCSWNGITCKQQRVVSVSIPNKKLSGSLSSSLGSLSQLRHLNLRSNNLSGGLSSLLFKAQKLQSLVLYGNSFSGTLPIEVGSLENVQVLDLSHNFLNGSLPTSLIQCKKLRNLALGHNNFSGSLPDGFGKNLILLEKLDLSYNEFGGSIPDDLGYLSNLQETFDLSHNKLNGSIPASFGNLPEKVYIDLTYNELTGPIPQNGALVNRGPTAFIGNPGLCGPPLKNLCSNESNSPAPFPYFPNNYSPQGGRSGLSKVAIVAIVVGDFIGICVIGLLFSYCYSRTRFCGKKKDDRSDGIEKGGRRRKECLCFRKDGSESLSENGDQYDLVHLDARGAFDLDELLKASAFVIGKTGIGLVYKVVLEDGLTLAVRRLGEGGWQRYKEFQTEVEAIGKLRHPNIVTLRAYYWSVEEKLLIYDFLPNGNLSAAIHGKAGQVAFNPLPWSMRLKIMKGAAKGLVYLHECSPKKYVHGDLKPSNVLLGPEMEPKISDFGLGHLASIAGGPLVLQSSPMASYYQAPEALKGAKPSQKWDVYSYGMILLEMVTGRSPLLQVENSEMDLVRWMQLCVEEERPIYDILDPYVVEDAVGKEEEEIIAVVKLAMSCTRSSPDRRPSMRSVFESLERLSFL